MPSTVPIAAEPMIMERKRIFINIHYLEIGGAETALIGLLHALDPERADVDLFINDHRGELMKFIPEWVRVLPPVGAYTMIERPIKEVLRAGYLRIALARLWAKVRFGLYARRKRPADGSAIFGYVGRYVTPVLPSLKGLGRYDLAVSFVTPHNVVLDKVCASRKVCWIHTDYTRIDTDAALELPIWSGYDRIVSISPDVTKCFLDIFPSLEGKITEIENIVPAELVRARSLEPAALARKDDKTAVLLTIGRYSYQKRLEDIPLICRALKRRGVRVIWYVIGYGGSDEYIRRAVAACGVENEVVLLGKQSNPYPYIRACDWYVQPSRYEGKSVAVREAQILCKPVIITDYPTSASQVRNGMDGVIVPMPVEACAEAMAAAISDEALRARLAGNLAACTFDASAETEKIYSLMR